jgi:hypothetical protein
MGHWHNLRERQSADVVGKGQRMARVSEELIVKSEE